MSPGPLPVDPAFVFAAAEEASTRCGFQGSDDILGLGVRLGIYLQWLSSILAENINHSDIATTRVAGNCYQVAMFAGLVRISQWPSDHIRALEGYIVLVFCFAGVWAASFGMQGSRRIAAAAAAGRVGQEPPMGSLEVFIGLALNTIISAYGIWFLFVGVHWMDRAPCEEVVFFFSRARLFGWVLTVLKVFFTISIVSSTALLVANVYQVVQSLGRELKDWDRRRSAPRPAAEGSKIVVHLGKTTGSSLALAIFIMSIELTLRWNHVTGVQSCNSFDQVFPLTVGAASFAGVAYGVGKGLLLDGHSYSFVL